MIFVTPFYSTKKAMDIKCCWDLITSGGIIYIPPYKGGDVVDVN